MKKMMMALLAAAFVAVISSCEHRVLVDLNRMHYLRVYLDEQIKNITCGIYNENYEVPEYKRPENFRAVLASPETGEIVAETILRNHGSDEKGAYVDGYITSDGGEYKLLVYNIGSSVTHICNTENIYDIEAYTGVVSDRILSYLPQFSDSLDVSRIFNKPDHLFVCAHETVKVPQTYTHDTLKCNGKGYFVASSVVKSYYLQLKITGVEYVNAAGAVLTGMASSNKFGIKDGLILEDPVHLFFSMNYADKTRKLGEEVSSAILYTTFNTFGKVNDISSVLYLNFEFIGILILKLFHRIQNIVYAFVICFKVFIFRILIF